jgi:hypothetical protein
MKKYKKYLILVILMIAIAVFFVCGFTLAKYVSNSFWDYYLKSKGFYFSSDYLGSTTIQNVNNLWDGDSVHFNIKNNLNQKVITNYDINYNASCTVLGEASSYVECHMGGTNSSSEQGTLSRIEACVNNTPDGINVSSFNETDCETQGYEWTDQIASKDLYFDIVLTDNNYQLKDLKVNVTVTSTSPYHKTLTGEFSLYKINNEGNSVSLSYKNYVDYDRLIVSNPTLENKCVEVSWDASKLIINADSNQYSSSELDENGYINKIKFNINAKNSASYIFYKRDFDMPYDVNEFNIIETDGC